MSPRSARTSTSPTPSPPLTSVCLYLCKVTRLCVCVWVCGCAICPIAAVYSRDFSHGNLVYLLYLQYNASLNISNFETQVSISRAAATCAHRCVCSARCREEMSTAAIETEHFKTEGLTKRSRNNTKKKKKNQK